MINKTYREKGHAVFLSAIMILSMVAAGAAFAGSAAAVDSVSDKQVSPDGEVTVTLTPDDTGNTLAISGDTDGWTLESTTPEGLTVNPQPGTELDPEGGEDDTISTFQSYDSNGQFSATLSPPSGASAGDIFQFDVQEVNDGNTVATDTLTIGIASSSVSAGLPDGETLTPSVTNGNSITQVVNVTNGGSEAATREVSLLVENSTRGVSQTIATDEVTLDPGQTIQTSLSGNVNVDETGEYTLAVAVDGSQRLTGGLTVTAPENVAAITGDVRDLEGNPVNNVDDITIRIFQDGDEIEASPQTPDENGEYTVRVPVQEGGSTYSVEVDEEDFETFSKEVLVEPQSAERIDIRLNSALEPEVLGVGAFNGEQIVGDSRTLFGNGEFDNQGQFAVFTQTQSDEEADQPVSDEVDVTLTVENISSDDPLRFVDPDVANENATQITVTIDGNSPTANIDGNEDTGIYSYETFNVTADNADEETLDDPITTEDFTAESLDIGDRSVATDPDVTATADPEVANTGLENSVNYVLKGDEIITGEVRDGVSQDTLEGVNVWVAYDGQSDTSYEFINSTFRDAEDEPFLSTTTTSDGAYTIRGLAGNNEDYTVYAYSEDNERYNRLNVDGTAADGAVTNGRIAHMQDLQTGDETGDTVTHDIALFEEEVEFEYRLDVTAEDTNGDQAKDVDVRQDESRTVEVTVERRAINSDADFSPAEDGVEVSLDLIANPDAPSQVGSLDDTTIETNANGIASATFTAFDAGEGIVNVTAEAENDDGSTASTDADQQALIDVFGAAELTGDVVDQNGNNLVGVTVELYRTADTSGTPVATRNTGSDGSYVFSEIDGELIRSGESFTVRAIDAEGNDATQSFDNVDATTNDRDIVIIDGVPADVPSDPDDGTDLSRFDTNGSGVIERGEAVEAVIAYNSDGTVGGETVSRENAVDVIIALNAGQSVGA